MRQRAVPFCSTLFGFAFAMGRATAAVAPQSIAPGSAECRALTALSIPGVTIDSAAVRDAGSFSLPGTGPGHSLSQAAPKVDLPVFCRVQAVALPSSDSTIHFEVWLPARKLWNGKLMAVGNGGYIGAISYFEMAPALRRGFAVVGGDTGHTGAGLEFGIGHPQKIRDWGDRSIHAITKGAKAITRAFERAPPRRSYYDGCSTGGHQGLTEAQRYPDDFDGIIAGAPGNDRTHLNAAFMWMGIENRKNPNGRLTAADLTLVSRAVLASCDAKDGLKDGIVVDPRRCDFNPETLRCRAGKTPDCLTGAQVATLRTLYGGLRNPRTGELIYPRYTQGSEAGWNMLLNGTEPYRTSFWSEWVFGDPTWSWKRFDVTRDVALADAKLGPIVNAMSPDLSAFRARGGKLILYQGWIDPVVSALDTLRYYDAVVRRMGGVRQTRRFARLFMVPAMGHCGALGGGSFDLLPISGRSGRDVVSLLDSWVERSIPPERLPVEERHGTRVVRTRVACAFPDVAMWNGTGDPNEAASFVCEKPSAPTRASRHD